MSKECKICGSTENLQKHHLSYEPEIIIDICQSCHEEIHDGHGVGEANGSEYDKLEDVEDEFVEDWESGMLVKDIAKKYSVTPVTVNNWRNRLGLEERGSESRRSIPISDDFEEIYNESGLEGLQMYQANISKLSGREYEVFLLTKAGLEPSDIAEELGIGASTVHSYLDRIEEKYNSSLGLIQMWAS